MTIARRIKPFLACVATLFLFACDPSVAYQDLDGIKKFILDALTTKSQKEHGPVTVEFDEILVRFAFSAEVPEVLQRVLEQTPQSMAVSPLALHTCPSWKETQVFPAPNCQESGTNVLVLVASGVDDLRALAGALAIARPEAKSAADKAVNVTDQLASTAIQLGKKGPPICVYTRQPDGEGKISEGAIVVLSLDNETAQACLLSSLYRIVGVEPYPEGRPATQKITYLSTHALGENPATALRFLYEIRPTARKLDELKRDIGRWVSSQDAQ